MEICNHVRKLWSPLSLCRAIRRWMLRKKPFSGVLSMTWRWILSRCHRCRCFRWWVQWKEGCLLGGRRGSRHNLHIRRVLWFFWWSKGRPFLLTRWLEYPLSSNLTDWGSNHLWCQEHRGLFLERWRWSYIVGWECGCDCDWDLIFWRVVVRGCWPTIMAGTFPWEGSSGSFLWVRESEMFGRGGCGWGWSWWECGWTYHDAFYAALFIR